MLKEDVAEDKSGNKRWVRSWKNYEEDLFSKNRKQQIYGFTENDYDGFVIFMFIILPRLFPKYQMYD